MTVAAVERPALRGKALAQWRRATAVDLASQGLSYDEIAEAVGYKNRGNAWRAVHDALDSRVAAEVESMRVLEATRLDRLQAALWPQAMAGDLRAVDRVLRIMQQRTRLLGLEQPPRPEDPPRPRATYLLLEGADSLTNLRFNTILAAEMDGRPVRDWDYEEAGLKPGEALKKVEGQTVFL